MGFPTFSRFFWQRPLFVLYQTQSGIVLNRVHPQLLYIEPSSALYWLLVTLGAMGATATGATGATGAATAKGAAAW